VAPDTVGAAPAGVSPAITTRSSTATAVTARTRTPADRSGARVSVISDNNLIFFRDNISGAGTGEHSAGAVARVRLFNRPLSQSEINDLGQTPATPCAT
jgi:hypothetical protein